MFYQFFTITGHKVFMAAQPKGNIKSYLYQSMLGFLMFFTLISIKFAPPKMPMYMIVIAIIFCFSTTIPMLVVHYKTKALMKKSKEW